MFHTESTEPQPISDHPAFHDLRRAQRHFGPWATVLSVGGFLSYVLLSRFLPAVMNQPLLGRLTLGLALGLAQFAVMAVTAWRCTRHMRTRVDPLARSLRSHLHHRRQPVAPGTREPRTW
ncbi:DUF485 domain-containing protein [Streptomyces sp. HUAS ZL42]|uniref:DUF485 domain-containing protein n=1 Tax=Streptomyces sp. HUAS ZL42 TaxID=3231715 RepID=UPI00345E7D66